MSIKNKLMVGGKKIFMWKKLEIITGYLDTRIYAIFFYGMVAKTWSFL